MTRLFDRSKKAGFTLVELIVVIAIIGILAGISVPVYNHYIFKAHKAGDLTLLAATNKSFASACLENGFDAADVLYSELDIQNGCIVGIKALTLKNGVTPRLLKAGPAADGIVFSTLSAGPRKNYQVVTLSSMAEVIDSMNTSFTKYYGDNTNTPLQYYTEEDIGFGGGVFGVAEDMATIATVLPSGKVLSATVDAASGRTSITVTDKNGNTIEYSMKTQDVANVGSSTFGTDMTMGELMGDVDTVVQAAVSALPGGTETLKHIIRMCGYTDLSSLGLGDKATAKEIGNALVMAVAQNTNENTREALLELAMGKEDFSIDLSDMGGTLSVVAGAYGMMTGLANSNIGKTRPVNVNGEEKTIYEYFTESSAALQKSNGGPEGLSNVMDMMETIMKSDAAQEYMSSGKAMEDLDGYLSAMSVISENSGTMINDNKVVEKGFTNDDFVEILNGIFGQSTATEGN